MGEGLLAGLAVVGSLAGGFFNEQAQEQEEQQLKLEEKEQELAATNQTIQRQNQLQSIVSAQQASFGARGLQASSASFRAITTQSFNNFAQDQQLANLDTKLKVDDLKQQRENLKSQMELGLLKTGLKVGTDLALAHKSFVDNNDDEQGQGQFGLPFQSNNISEAGFLPSGLSFLPQGEFGQEV